MVSKYTPVVSTRTPETRKNAYTRFFPLNHSKDGIKRHNDVRGFDGVVHCINCFLCYLFAPFLGDSAAGYAETCHIVRVTFNKGLTGLEIKVS